MFLSIIPPSKEKKKRKKIYFSVCLCVGTCMWECRCPGSPEEATGLGGARVTGRCGAPAQVLVSKPGSCESAMCALNPHHFFSLHSTAVLRQGLSMNITSLVRLAGQGAPGSPRLPPHLWDCRQVRHSVALMWVLGSELRSLCMYGKCFTNSIPATGFTSPTLSMAGYLTTCTQFDGSAQPDCALCLP